MERFPHGDGCDVTDTLFLYGTLLPGLEPPPLTALVASLEPLGEKAAAAVSH